MKRFSQRGISMETKYIIAVLVIIVIVLAVIMGAMMMPSMNAQRTLK